MPLVKLQVRRDSAADWLAANPVLADGEIGLETDTNKVKYGDGVRNWLALPYSSGVSLASLTPSPVGAAGAGTSDFASRADHSHALPANLSASTLTTSGNANVGGSLTVSGPLVGGAHSHLISDITGFPDAVFSALAAAIKAGANVGVQVNPTARTITVSSTGTGTSPLSITQDPQPQTTSTGTATFTARAAGGSGVIAYQWQSSADAGVSWTNIPNATGVTLALTGLSAANDGTLYRLQATSDAESVFSLSAKLTIATIAITAQPPDVTAAIGQMVQLSVAANAGSAALAYQWQSRDGASAAWVSIPNATLSTYSFTPAQATDADGVQYQAVVMALGQTATSRTATVIVRGAGLAITTQPADVQDVSGGATLAVDVAGGTAPYAYQWQRLGGGSSSWATTNPFANIPSGTSGVSGQTTDELTLTGQDATQHLRRYRVIVTDAAGQTATSREATLATLSLRITKQPVDVAAADGATLAAAAFVAEGTADGGVTYQWQKSTNAGSTWSNISGATSASYGGITVSYSDDNTLFRCNITGDGQTLPTSSAELSVSAPPLTITTQPADVTASAGAASVTFAYSGGPSGTATISWEMLPIGGAWQSIAGITTTTLALTGLSVAQTGMKVRATVVKGSATARTAEATVTVPGVIISLQPINRTAVSGSTATFTFDFTAIECPTPAIQWQVRSSTGSAWTNVSGGTGKTLTLTSVATAQSGYQYRAGATCSGLTTYSTIVTLTVTPPILAITTQPADVTASLGNATFSFAYAGGDGSTATIAWERAAPGGYWAPVAGATTTTLALTGVSVSLSGAQYRATVTVGAQRVTTREAVLTVAGASITLHPVDATAFSGEARFTMDYTASVCENAEIQWEKKRASDTSWFVIPNSNAKSLPLSALTSADSGWAYRAAVMCGREVSYTSAATLTVPSYEFFTSHPQSQDVYPGDNVTFSYSGLYSADVYPARWQWRRIGQTEWTYYTRPGASAQSISFIAVPLAHARTEWRVEVSLPSSKLYSNVATLNVGIVTSRVQVNLAGNADLIGVAYSPTAQAYVALSSDQTGLALRSTDGGLTWDYSFLPTTRYWDGIVCTQQGVLIAYSSGDSGVPKAVPIDRTGSYTWGYGTPPSGATLAWSSDGGSTWTGGGFPFFVGSRLRMFALPYQNALLAFYRDASLTSYIGIAGQTAVSQQTRYGAYRGAVSLNNGVSWQVFDMPALSSAALWMDNYTKSGVPEWADVTSAAISPSGILALTSRITPVGWRTAVGNWAYFHAYQGYERTGRLMYRNVAATGWGTPAFAQTSSVGVSTGSPLHTLR